MRSTMKSLSSFVQSSIASGAGREALPIHVLKATTNQSAQRRGLIVLQEWWGVSPQLKAQAVRLSNDSELDVLIPDIYRGELATNAKEAEHKMDGLDFPGAVIDIHAAARHLRDVEKCSSVGVVGFCMGGALSLAATILDKQGALDAGVNFYGICPTELADPLELNKPLQCHYGEVDPLEGFSDKQSYLALKEKVAKSPAASMAEFYGYEAQGHAFMNDDKDLRAAAGVEQQFNQEQVDLAYGRVKTFLAKHLK